MTCLSFGPTDLFATSQTLNLRQLFFMKQRPLLDLRNLLVCYPCFDDLARALHLFATSQKVKHMHLLATNQFPSLIFSELIIL